MIWLLTVEWDGETVRRSTSPGSWGGYPYDGGLDDAQVTSSLAAAGSADPSVSLSISWPDVAARIARGANLSTARGELAVIPEGIAFEHRVVVVSGPLVQPTYGSDRDPVAFTISGAEAASLVLFPNPAHRLTKAAWSASLGKGQQYPTVFGCPGWTSATEIVPATPAYWLSSSKWLIAGHHTVESGTVTLFGEQASGDYVAAASISHDHDDLGRAISIVTSAAALTDKPLWVGWGSSSAPCYSLHVDGRPLKTAGEVILWLLAKSGSTDGFELLRHELTAVNVSGFLDAPVSPRAFVEDSLLPLLPVSLAWTSRGMRPILRPQTLRPGPHLRVEPGFMVRRGVVTYDRPLSALVNDHTFAWGYDLRDSGMTQTTRTGGTTAPSWARNSQLQHDERSAMSESAFLYDRGSASYVSSWRCRETAYSRRTLRYSCRATRELLAVVPGDCVTLTDPEIFLVAAPGWVSGTSWDVDGLVELTVKLFDPREL